MGSAGSPPVHLGERLSPEEAQSLRIGGLGRDGGMAEYMIVLDGRLLVRLGKLDPSNVLTVGRSNHPDSWQAGVGSKPEALVPQR
jgi:hypothetical protein